ncbi:MAG: transglutaminase TgpA family protein [Acidiferrobacterales bacterium]
MTPVSANPVDRHGVNWLLACAVIVLAPLATHLPVWLDVLSAALLLIRYVIARRGWPLPRRFLRVALTVALTAGVYLRFGTVLGRDAGIALLVGMLALKFLEVRTLRDAALCVFLLYFLTLGSFLFSQSLWLAAYLGIAVVLSTATLVRVSFPQGPGAGASLRLSLALLVKAVPLTVVLFLFFPRIQGALWALPADAHGASTGMSDTMSPGSINELAQSDAVAFRVAFRGPPPPAKDLYWRSLVLWDTNGRIWSRGNVARQQVLATGNTPVRYEVTLEASDRPWLVSLDWPGSAPAGAEVSAGDVLEFTRPVRERLRYPVLSYLHPRSRALSAAARSRALALPPSTTARVRALAQGWRARESEASGVVNDALDFFRGKDFVYTLRPPLLGANPVDEFLFDTRRGFCEHYAAAFVTLMRAAGIPSRVVVGYQGGEYNPGGGYFIVRQSDAHAWAEVWLAGRGWVRVDPTAAVAPERIEYGEDVLRRLLGTGMPLDRFTPAMLRRAIELGWFGKLGRSAGLAWDSVNTAWYEWVLDYSRSRQNQMLKHLGLDHWPRSLVTVGAFAVMILMLGIYALTLGLRKREDPVKAAYRRFCAKLARVGLPRAPWEGPSAFADRVALARPDLRDEIGAVTRAYIDLRYGETGDAGALRRRVAAFKVRRRRPVSRES